MSDGYLWLKAAHIVAVIAWMAGIFYLPRLFVYHAGAAAGSDTSETFKIMERRLHRAIMTPAMIAVWLSGLGLAWLSDAWSEPWFMAKAALVIALTAFHVWLGARRRDFAADRNRLSARAWRIANEIPTLVVVAIVVLVVVKPF